MSQIPTNVPTNQTPKLQKQLITDTFKLVAGMNNLTQWLILYGTAGSHGPVKHLSYSINIHIITLLFQKKKYHNISISVMLTCALRAQVKKVKMELKHKFCLENIRF